MVSVLSILWLLVLINLCDGYGFIQRDIIFMIDVSATVTATGVTQSVTLCQDIAKNYPIFDDTVRIGAVAFHDSTVLLFDLNTYNNYEDVATGLSTATYVGGNGDIGVALDYVRGRFQGGNNGDRTTVADVIVMITDGISTNMLTAGDNANAAGWEIHIVGVTPNAFPYYIDYASDYSYYATNYASMYSSVYTSLISNLPSAAVCGNYWIRYDEPGNLIASTDTSSGTGYFLLDDTFKVTCCGVINTWSFYAATSGQIYFQVWRVSGSSYYLVGQNTYTVSVSEVGTTKTYSVSTSERISVIETDRIGWYCPGTNVIPYSSCTTASQGNCPQLNRRSSMSSPSVGSTKDWSSVAAIPNVAYAIKWYTGDSVTPVFSSTTTSLRISDDTAVGTSVVSAAFTDTDAGDTLTYSLIDTYYEIDTSGIIKVKATLPTSASDTISTLPITAIDTCQNTASGTFTITSYNVPPSFGGLPGAVYLSEDTSTETKLKDLDVSSDALCCIISGIIPSTTNFKLVNSGGYAIYYGGSTALDYDVASKYTLYVCCDDGIVTNTSYLTVAITDISVKQTTEVPSFVSTGLMVCLIPIGLLFGLSCALLGVTVWVH